MIKNEFKYSDYDTCKVQINFIHSSDRTLSKQLTYYTAYQEIDGKKITYKITVPKTGRISLGVFPYDSDTSYDVSYRLLDKNKKQLVKEKYQTSLDSDNEANNKYYTLNKGTYYVQVDTNCVFYDIAYRFTPTKDQSGTQKSKAKAIKMNGSDVEGYFTNTEKKSKVDWYKINVTATKYIEIFIGYYSDGNFKYELVDSNGKVVKSKVFKGEYVGAYDYTVYGTLNKGTYYIKITKLEATGSMSYYINVKS